MYRDGHNVTARLKAEVDAAATEADEDDVAMAAAWERLDDMRRVVGKDTHPDVWRVDPERWGSVQVDLVFYPRA